MSIRVLVLARVWPSFTNVVITEKKNCNDDLIKGFQNMVCLQLVARLIVNMIVNNTLMSLFKVISFYIYLLYIFD